jgi:branched-chain amino acid transport system ATP-binding protein
LASPEPAFAMRGVGASYGSRRVLTDFNLEVGPGEIVAVLGHNGAGKTTALRIASGLKKPSGGSVQMGGRDLRGTSASARARSGLSLVPEGVQGIFPTLTVRQNLDAVRVREEEIDDDLEQVLHDSFGDVLIERPNQVAGSMSGGQRQMLALALALIRRPKVLLLDEPSTGLAPIIVERIFNVVADLAPRSGMAVIVVEQDVASALRVASRVVVVQSGKLVAEFPKDQLPSATELWRLF